MTADLFESARATRRAKMAELLAQQQHHEAGLSRIERERASLQAALDTLDEAAEIIARTEQAEDRPMRDLILADLRAKGPKSLDQLSEGRNRRSVAHSVRHALARGEIHLVGEDLYSLPPIAQQEAAG